MKTLIICQSTGSTLKVAQAMQEAINAELVTPENTPSIQDYDLIGLGSGIFNRKHSQSILNIAKDILDKDFFIFSTNTLGLKHHKTLKNILKENSNSIVGEFACKGKYKWGFLTLNKKHPNEKDLKKAKDFALTLKV